MKPVNKEEYLLLVEILHLKRKLGIAEHPNEIDDLYAERDRLRKMVKVCYGE